MTNEQIYADMVENRISLDLGIETLVQHLRPIIINASRGFIRVLSWTWDDALQEARILLWELVEKRRFRPQRASVAVRWPSTTSSRIAFPTA